MYNYCSVHLIDFKLFGMFVHWDVQLLGCSTVRMSNYWNVQLFGMFNYWDVKLLECSTIAMFNYCNVQLWGCPTIGMFNDWNVQLLPCSTVVMFNYWSVQLLECWSSSMGMCLNPENGLRFKYCSLPPLPLMHPLLEKKLSIQVVSYKSLTFPVSFLWKYKFWYNMITLW